MSGDFDFKISGESELLRNIERLGLGMIAQAQEVGAEVGEELVLVPARDRAPKKTGRLRRSGFVRARKFRDAVVVKIIFGGELAPYAAFVHENLEAHYKVGEAKFLERTFLAARNDFVPAVAARFSLAKAVRG
jgi:hypothetical protein